MPVTIKTKQPVQASAPAAEQPSQLPPHPFSKTKTRPKVKGKYKARKQSDTLVDSAGRTQNKDLYKVLTKDQIAMVDYELMKGTSHLKVAQMVQEEFGVYPEVSRAAMRQFIMRYDNKLIRPVEDGMRIAMGLDSTQSPLVVLEKVKNTLDIMQEVGLLVALQKSRVSKLYEREKAMPMLFATLGSEVRTLAALVGQYAEHAFDLGRLHKVPTLTKVTKQGESTFIESTGRDHVMFSLERTKQVEDAADKFFKVLSGEVVEVEPDEYQNE